MRVEGEVERAEGDVPERGGGARAVHVPQPEVGQHGGRGGGGEGAVAARHLEPDLDDLQRVGEHHVGEAGAGARHQLPRQGDVAVRGLGDLVPHQVVGRELDRLLGRHGQQVEAEAAVQPRHALVPERLRSAVHGALAETK